MLSQACCLCSISACSSPRSPRASGSLGGLAHTQGRACACLSCVRARAAVWQLRENPEIQIALQAGPQPTPPPSRPFPPPSLLLYPPLQRTAFKLNHSTALLYWLHTHTHTLFFLSALCVFVWKGIQSVLKGNFPSRPTRSDCVCLFYFLFFLCKVHLSASPVFVSKTRLFLEVLLQYGNAHARMEMR